MVISPAACDYKLTSDLKIKLIFQPAWATDCFEFTDIFGVKQAVFLPFGMVHICPCPGALSRPGNRHLIF